jgi:hypothetical protein
MRKSHRADVSKSKLQTPGNACFVYHAGSDAVFTMPEKNKYDTQTI